MYEKQEESNDSSPEQANTNNNTITNNDNNNNNGNDDEDDNINTDTVFRPLPPSTSTCLHCFCHSRGGMQTITSRKIYQQQQCVLVIDEENNNNNDIVLSSPVLIGRSDDGYDGELISESVDANASPKR